MPRVTWYLRNGCPVVRVVLTLAAGNVDLPRYLLADTGAGHVGSGFELILAESDCILCGGVPVGSVGMSGAYSGSYPLYRLRVRIPELAFDWHLLIAGIPMCPVGFDGVAGFRFLNDFTYGNFGNQGIFGLEN